MRTFKLYPFLEEYEVYCSFLREIEYFNLKEVIPLFKQAWNSQFWVEHGYDGASVVQDQYHPRLANFIHDYLYRMGMGGIEADTIYKNLLRRTGSSEFLYESRYIVIRIAWCTYFKWKHLLNGNVTELNPVVKSLYYLYA